MEERDTTTYNRVDTLRSPIITLLTAGYVITASLALVCVICSFLLGPNKHYILMGLIAALISFFIYCSATRYGKRCQFCGNQLSYTQKPFLLTSKYLTRKGRLINDVFYTQLSRPFNRSWVKISMQSLACHYCRQTEKRNIESIQKINNEEIIDLKLSK